MGRLREQLSKVVGRGGNASTPADYVRSEFVDSGFLANDEHRHSWSLNATCAAFSSGLPSKLDPPAPDQAVAQVIRHAHAVVSAKPAWPRAR